MFLSYLFKGQSDRAKIWDLEVSLHALSFEITKKIGQHLLYDRIPRVDRGPSLKLLGI